MAYMTKAQSYDFYNNHATPDEREAWLKRLEIERELRAKKRRIIVLRKANQEPCRMTAISLPERLLSLMDAVYIRTGKSRRVQVTEAFAHQWKGKTDEQIMEGK